MNSYGVKLFSAVKVISVQHCVCVSQNGKISFEEFVCGLAVLLHGSFSNKCQLLFQVFNIHGDEGELMGPTHTLGASHVRHF